MKTPSRRKAKPSSDDDDELDDEEEQEDMPQVEAMEEVEEALDSDIEHYPGGTSRKKNLGD
jgi:hypothetical protein